MFTRKLEAFIITAKAKSFQKASEQLFISPTSLMKQMKALEADTGLTLFKRTNRGVFLTEEGKAFYDTAYSIVVNYHNGIQSAKNIHAQTAKAIHIGFSPVNPYCNCEEILCYDATCFSRFTFFVEEIRSNYKDFFDEMNNLGTYIDLIPHFCGQLALEASCNCFCVSKVPLGIAVPIGHPLSRKEVLTFEDLNGCDLMTISSDANRYYQKLNQAVLDRAPEVNLIPVQHFDVSTLNQAGVCQYLVLVGNYLKDAHPMLKVRQVDWDLTLPYGLYYSKNPSSNVLDFFDSMRKAGISGEYEDAMTIDF